MKGTQSEWHSHTDLACHTQSDLYLETAWLTLPVLQWAATYQYMQGAHTESKPLSPIPKGKPVIHIYQKVSPSFSYLKVSLHIYRSHAYMGFIQTQYKDLIRGLRHSVCNNRKIKLERHLAQLPQYFPLVWMHTYGHAYLRKYSMTWHFVSQDGITPGLRTTFWYHKIN